MDKCSLKSGFTAYRQPVGGPWMAVNEARRSEGMPNVDGVETVQQAVNMAPLGWVPVAVGGMGGRRVIRPESLGREVMGTRTVTRRMILRLGSRIAWPTVAATIDLCSFAANIGR